MGEYLYWHAPLWEIVLVIAVSLALLAVLITRALRRPDPGAALDLIAPALNAHPLFFFDRARGITCLNDAAKQLLRRLSASQDQLHLNTLTEMLLEAYQAARIIQKEGWPEAGYTLVMSPISTQAGSMSGVLAFATVEHPLLLADSSPEADPITERSAWLTIGEELRVHSVRPIVQVRRSVPSTLENDAPIWEEYQLSHLEDTLLRYLLDHAAEVQSAKVLFKVLWPDDDVGEYGLRPEQQDRLRRVVYQLRQHTEPDPRSPRFVVTAHGVGYALYPEQELAVE